MEGGGRVVCVTGASGYLASWLVKHLLSHGYCVKATVRDQNDDRKTNHLRALDGARERLELFNADLMEDGSFDSAVSDCECVFHTASPVPTSPISDKRELVDPAVKGTLNVLKSCVKVASVKRVVLTSSIASVMYNRKPLTHDVVIDETWYSDPDYCEDLQLWYMLSKTLAEDAAWKYAKEKGIDMISINPGFVIGPSLQPILTSTLTVFLDFIKGEMKGSIPFYVLVDVRDVADTHIKAFEVSSASGRYCIVGEVLHSSELSKMLTNLYPTLHIHKMSKDEEPTASVPKFRVSNEKAKTLGIEFTDLKVSITDTIESFKEKYLLSI